jgi:predicted house-cleaning noncanonical NTP pyrophosphatase (MazG superfamily)
MKIDTKLSEVFEVEPTATSEVIQNQPEIVIDSNSDKIDSDYEITRINLRKLLVQGQEALQNALEVAKQSEHPRAFEVVGNLMKQLADVNQQLLELHQQKQKLDAPKEAAKKEVTNNNAIFVGSTAELNKLIKNMSKGE